MTAAANAKILVIDDEPHIRLLYKEVLEGEGHDMALSDGQEDILPLLDREAPDLLILDIKLDNSRSGLDLLQEIRRDQRTLPVILSTAYDGFQNDLKSIAADYYVVKSVDLTELKEKVDLAIAGLQKAPTPG